MSLIRGEAVIVERRRETGRDAANLPVYEWDAETVENVCVAPGARADLPGDIRPDGVRVAWTLHFPKGYPETLKGARVRVRGGDPCFVIGEPRHYTEANTPGPWSMPVEVEATSG